jgi:hypothetical protein
MGDLGAGLSPQDPATSASMLAKRAAFDDARRSRKFMLANYYKNRLCAYWQLRMRQLDSPVWIECPWSAAFIAFLTFIRHCCPLGGLWYSDYLEVSNHAP